MRVKDVSFQVVGTTFLTFAILCLGIPANAERPSLGVQAGVVLTDFFVPGQSSARICACFTIYMPATKRITGGPTFEYRFRGFGGRWAAETGFLLKRVNYSFQSRFGFLPRFEATGNTAANSWEIPLLIRTRIRRRLWEASGGGGPALRILGQFQQQFWETESAFNTVILRRRTQSDPPEFRKRVYTGLALAAGTAVRIGHVRVGPELRYTRWLANANESGFPPLQFRPNQLEVLLGVRFQLPGGAN